MTRKHTRRKHWNLTDPIALAVAGARPIDDTRLALLRALEFRALEAFRTGAATRDDWCAIADMVNLSETLCDMGVGDTEVRPVAAMVQDHLGASFARYEHSGRIATTGPGLRAFFDLQEYHDLQRTSVSLSTYEKAIQRTRNRIRSAHPSLKVYINEPRKEPA